MNVLFTVNLQDFREFNLPVVKFKKYSLKNYKTGK